MIDVVEFGRPTNGEQWWLAKVRNGSRNQKGIGGTRAEAVAKLIDALSAERDWCDKIISEASSLHREYAEAS